MALFQNVQNVSAQAQAIFDNFAMSEAPAAQVQNVAPAAPAAQVQNVAPAAPAAQSVDYSAYKIMDGKAHTAPDGTTFVNGIEVKNAKTLAKQTIVAWLVANKDSLPADIREAAETFAPSAFGLVDFNAARGAFGIKPTFFTAAQKRLLTLAGVDAESVEESAAAFEGAINAARNCELDGLTDCVVVSEDDCFMRLKYGRGDMKKLCNELRKTPKNCRAVYSYFSENEGKYYFAFRALTE